MRKTCVRKIILCLLAALFLAGCSKDNIVKDIASLYSGKGIDAKIGITMTYKDKLNEYVMTQSFKDENSHFSLIEPEALKGIEADISPDGTVTFAGIALAPANIPEGFSVFALLHAAMRSLSSAQAAECSEIEGEYMVSRDIYIGDKTFLLEEWFDKNLAPMRFDIMLEGERIIQGEYSEFETK